MAGKEVFQSGALGNGIKWDTVDSAVAWNVEVTAKNLSIEEGLEESDIDALLSKEPKLLDYATKLTDGVKIPMHVSFVQSMTFSGSIFGKVAV